MNGCKTLIFSSRAFMPAASVGTFVGMIVVFLSSATFRVGYHKGARRSTKPCGKIGLQWTSVQYLGLITVYPHETLQSRNSSRARAHITPQSRFLLSSVKNPCFQALFNKSQTFSDTTTVPSRHYRGTLTALPRCSHGTTAVLDG